MRFGVVAVFVEFEHRFEDLIGIVDDLHQVHVAGLISPMGVSEFLNQSQQTFPELAANQNDRHMAGFFRLDQCEDFSQFIECAEAAGHDDHRVGVFTNVTLRVKK